MITVKFFERNDRYAISASGHANYAPFGQDIVCAGISVLMESLSNYLDEYAKDYNWHILENRIDDNGDMNIEVLDTKGEMYYMFKMVEKGIESISMQYPAFVKIY